MASLASSVTKWPVTQGDAPPSLSSPSGRIVLLGDAATSTPPFLAQGAALAIEDAVLLAKVVSDATSSDGLPGALAVYDRCRRRRRTAVQDLTMRSVGFYHLEDGPAQRARDLAAEKGSDFPAGALSRDPVLGGYLYGFDAEDTNEHNESEKLLKILESRLSQEMKLQASFVQAG